NREGGLVWNQSQQGARQDRCARKGHSANHLRRPLPAVPTEQAAPTAARIGEDDATRSWIAAPDRLYREAARPDRAAPQPLDPTSVQPRGGHRVELGLGQRRAESTRKARRIAPPARSAVAATAAMAGARPPLSRRGPGAGRSDPAPLLGLQR